MSLTEPTDGTSFLSRLDRYWVRRPPAQVPVLSNEHLICVSPEHWIKYVFPSIIYMALVLVSLLAIWFSSLVAETAGRTSLFVFLFALVLLFFTHHWFYWYLLAESQAHIIVTSKRVIRIHENLLWREDMVDVSFEKMKTVEAHKLNLLQAVLNYGTLEFEAKAKITRVPHPGTLAMKIEQAMGMA